MHRHKAHHLPSGKTPEWVKPGAKCHVHGHGHGVFIIKKVFVLSVLLTATDGTPLGYEPIHNLTKA